MTLRALPQPVPAGDRGLTLIWIGWRKTVGRGEGSSHLGFDQIVDLPAEKELIAQVL